MSDRKTTILGNRTRISTLLISISVFAINGTLLPYAQAHEQGERSARMEKDVGDLLDQTAAAIQTALDQKTFEVKNPEKLFMARLERGLDRAGMELANAAPETVAEVQTKLDLDGAAINAQEVVNSFSDQKSEIRLAVARELAQIREKNPEANSVVNYLQKTQQKLLNRGITIDLPMFLFAMTLIGTAVLLIVCQSMAPAGIYLLVMMCVTLHYGQSWVHPEAHVDHSVVNMAATSEPLIQFGHMFGPSPEEKDFGKSFDAITARANQQLIRFTALSPAEAERQKPEFVGVVEELKNQHEALKKNLETRKWFHSASDQWIVGNPMNQAKYEILSLERKISEAQGK